MIDAAMALDRGDASAPAAPIIDLEDFLPATQAEKLVDLFSRKDVLQAFDCGNNKFYRMLDAGQLEAVYVGGRIMITGTSIRRCLAALPKYQPRQAVG
jgi:hypothetical protein